MVIGAQVKLKELCILKFKPTIYDRQLNLCDLLSPRAPYGAIAGEGVKYGVFAIFYFCLTIFYQFLMIRQRVSYNIDGYSTKASHRY